VGKQAECKEDAALTAYTQAVLSMSRRHPEMLQWLPLSCVKCSSFAISTFETNCLAASCLPVNLSACSRSILAVTTRFPELLPPQGSSSKVAVAGNRAHHASESAATTDQEAPGAAPEGDFAVQEPVVAHVAGLLTAARRRLARRLRVASSVSTTAHISGAEYQLPGVGIVKCNPWLVLDGFQQLFKDLGQINNQVAI
jgi:hypothetical protein